MGPIALPELLPACARRASCAVRRMVWRFMVGVGCFAAIGVLKLDYTVLVKKQNQHSLLLEAF